MILLTDVLVEEAHALDLIAAGDAHGARQPPRDAGARALPGEIKARSNLLLERARQIRVGRRIEHPRLPEGSLHAIFGEPVAATARRRRLIGEDRRILRVQAEAREQIDRAVLAPQIAASDLKRRARRELELLGRDATAFRSSYDARTHFPARAISDARRRGLFDGDEQIARRLGAVPQFGDPCAPEKAQRSQALLRVVDGRLPQGIARTDLKRPHHRFLARAHVPHDEHVVDEDARAFVDREHDVDEGLVAVERRHGVDGDILVSDIRVLELQRVAVRGHLRAIERISGCQPETRTQCAFRHGLIPGDLHRHLTTLIPDNPH